jgi:hypothetical protein
VDADAGGRCRRRNGDGLWRTLRPPDDENRQQDREPQTGQGELFGALYEYRPCLSHRKKPRGFAAK